MLGDQLLGVMSSAFQCWQIAFVTDVPKRYTNVTQKSAALDSFDRRCSEHLAELLVGQREIITHCDTDCRGPRLKRCLARRFSEPIPWTGIETIVTAEYSVANEGSQLKGDR